MQAPAADPLMQAVLPPARTLPLHAAAASRTAERDALAGSAPFALMRAAGAAVARLALAVAPHADRVWIAAGPGNNGGDGLEAALGLRHAGKAVHVTLTADTARLPADAAQALRRALDAGVPVSAHAPAPALAAHDLAIDALLGLGTRRAPAGVLAQQVHQLNALPCGVLAIDLPSGLLADTGQPAADGHGAPGVAVRASHTLSLLTLKPGLFTATGRDHAGQVWFDPLGIEPRSVPPTAWLAARDAFEAVLRPRAHDRHKGSFGDVVVVGGAPGMTGAALLAARAAHAAGAGRVHVRLLDPGASGADPLRPELMLHPAGWRPADAARPTTTTLCGCGGGEAVRGALTGLLGSTARLVLDADALNAVATDDALSTQLSARAARGLPTVLTPHPLEAARLLGCPAAAVQADRLAAASRLASRWGCVVVLKGSGTVVTAPDALPFINPTGNAALSSAGTGDVLAGWIAGLWAQHAAGAHDHPVAIACRAALAACYLHGAAADVARAVPLRAGDLVDAMHALQGRWIEDGRPGRC